jgi:rhodanese-related sulfurtransferase
MKKPFSLMMILTMAALVTCWMACAPTSETGNELAKSQRFERLMKKSNTVVLDVRTPEEYKEGHLPNAVLLDFNGGVFDAEFAKLDRSKNYLVYCKSGRRSDKAAGKMKGAGFSNVIQLKGGIQAWTGELVK